MHTAGSSERLHPGLQTATFPLWAHAEGRGGLSGVPSYTATGPCVGPPSWPLPTLLTSQAPTSCPTGDLGFNVCVLGDTSIQSIAVNGFGPRLTPFLDSVLGRQPPMRSCWLKGCALHTGPDPRSWGSGFGPGALGGGSAGCGAQGTAEGGRVPGHLPSSGQGRALVMVFSPGLPGGAGLARRDEARACWAVTLKWVFARRLCVGSCIAAAAPRGGLAAPDKTLERQNLRDSVSLLICIDSGPRASWDLLGVKEGAGESRDMGRGCRAGSLTSSWPCDPAPVPKLL